MSADRQGSGKPVPRLLTKKIPMNSNRWTIQQSRLLNVSWCLALELPLRAPSGFLSGAPPSSRWQPVAGGTRVASSAAYDEDQLAKNFLAEAKLNCITPDLIPKKK